MITALLPRMNVNTKDITCYVDATEAERDKFVAQYYIKVNARELYGTFKVYEMLPMESLSALFVLQKDMEHVEINKKAQKRLKVAPKS